MKPTSLCILACILAVSIYTVIGNYNRVSESKRNTSFLINSEENQEEEENFASDNEFSVSSSVKEASDNAESNIESYFKGIQNLIKFETNRKELNLLVLGDFGYLSGKQHAGTLELANFFINRVKKTFLHYDFVVSVGDILYDFGVESLEDPKPRILFEDVFKMDQLGLDWYSALGNHDCMGNLPATYALADNFSYWKQSEPYYYKIFNIGDSHLKASFVFLNGCELVCLTHDSPECYRGTLKNINFDILQDQVDWFERVLAKMAEDQSIVWRIVVVHNGIFSAGVSHGDNPDLKEAILPLLVKYKVDLVLSGHDHNVQYLRMDLNESKQGVVKEDEEKVNCPDNVDKDECIFGEFFHSDLTECGIRKKEPVNKLQGLYQGIHRGLIGGNSRESYSKQYEYLHQFIIGNGGTKMQRMCPYKQKDSEGNLRYGHTEQGIADLKIKEDRLEMNLVSIKNEILYSVKILRETNYGGEL